MTHNAHDPPGHGHAGGFVIGSHCHISGGNFTIHNSHSTLTTDQQAKQHLCSVTLGAPNIDVRLLHSSSEHALVELGETASQQAEKVLESARRAKHAISYHAFTGLIDKTSARPLALALAHKAESQGILLGTLLLSPTARQSSCIVPTLAYQLVCAIPQTAKPMLQAILHDPSLFKLNARTQLERLIEHPLKQAAQEASLTEKATWPSVIVIDGAITSSVRQEIIASLDSLASDSCLGLRLSVIAINETPLAEAATRISLLVYHIALERAPDAFYFNWRVHAEGDAADWAARLA